MPADALRCPTLPRMPAPTSRRWSRLLAAAGMIGAALTAAVGCGAQGPPAPAPAQWTFQQEVVSDRGTLFTAKIYSRIPPAVQVGQTIVVKVEVCGPRGDCPAARSIGSPSGPGTPAPAATMQAGAQILAHLEADPPGRVDSGIDRTQPVIEETDYADWQWTLHADHAGSFEVRIGLTPLSAATNTPLMPTTTVAGLVTVTEPTNRPNSSAIGESPPLGAG
jgi:hypothetical protein